MSESYIVAIASSLTAIFAILAPIIVAIINNKHTKKLKEIELIYEAKINTYKEFLSDYGKFQGSASYVNLERLGESTSKAMLYATPKIREKLQNILEYVSKGDSNNRLPISVLEDNYRDLIPLIYEEINKKGS